MQTLIEYRKIDEQLAEACLNTMGRHLWYVTEETVTLALFSSKVPDSTKAKMAEKLLIRKKPEHVRLGKPDFPIKVGKHTQLDDLVGPSSWLLLERTGAAEWLTEAPETWNNSEAFASVKQLVTGLKSVMTQRNAV